MKYRKLSLGRKQLKIIPPKQTSISILQGQILHFFLASFLLILLEDILKYTSYLLLFRNFLSLDEEKKGNNKDEFNMYIKMGGLPLIHHMNLEEEVVYLYLKGVFSTILFKDIVNKHKIRNANLLFDIFTLLCDTTGSIVSTKKIVDYLKKEKISLSLDTLRVYLFFLQDSYLLYKAARYDIKGKRCITRFAIF